MAELKIVRYATNRAPQARYSLAGVPSFLRWVLRYYLASAPVIGKTPHHAGLWFDFGHQHHEFTCGPASGCLLAEIMTGEPRFADPSPFAAERFA